MRNKNMETLQTIETKIDKLIEQNKKDIETTEAELVKVNQAISDAQTKLVQAQKEINSEKYVEAKSELWTAERTKEFHEERLKWWIDKLDGKVEHLFSFEQKKIYNLFADYPHNMTEEEVEIFDQENSFWRGFFSDRKP